MAMETPNTRSRRKREEMESDSVSVSWAIDEELRKTVLLASESLEAIPPTPTQAPRSIPIRTPASSHSLPTPTSKRPRRNRSLPTQLATPQKDRDKLDLLLGQVQARLGSQGASVLSDRTNVDRATATSSSRMASKGKVKTKAMETPKKLPPRSPAKPSKRQTPTVDPKAPCEAEGDSSFDSLDGLFAQGGQDVSDFLMSL